MADVVVNYWAVLVSGVAAMILGFVWYMPSVMGNTWMMAIGKTKEELQGGANPMMYFGTYVMAIVTAYILAHFMWLIGVATISDALATAFWVWLGFVATVMAMNLMYEGRTWKLFWINGIYQLISLGVMAVILFYWQ